MEIAALLFILITIVPIITVSGAQEIPPEDPPAPTIYTVTGYLRSDGYGFIRNEKLNIYAGSISLGEAYTNDLGYFSMSFNSYMTINDIIVKADIAGFDYAQLSVHSTGVNFNFGQFYLNLQEDNTCPTINHPSDISYEAGTVGNIITWIGIDDHPDQYTLYNSNGEVVQIGMWSSSIGITINFDGLVPGTHTFYITLQDHLPYQNGLARDEVIVKVYDVMTVFGVIKNDWDSNPMSNVNVQLHGQLVGGSTEELIDSCSTSGSGTYSVEAPINGDYSSFKLTLSKLGFFSYTETYGPYVDAHDLNVMLIPEDDTIPTVTNRGNINIIDTTGIQRPMVQWDVSDNFPTYYRISQGADISNWYSWNNGDLIQVDLSDYSLGEYNFEITLKDYGNHIVTDTVNVKLLKEFRMDGIVISDHRDIPLKSANIQILGMTDYWREIHRFGTNDSGQFEESFGYDPNISQLQAKITYPGHSSRTISLNMAQSHFSGEISLDPSDITVPTLTRTGTNSDTTHFYIEEFGDVSFGWKAIDDHPSGYAIFINNVFTESGDWNSNQEFNFELSNLAFGEYSYTLRVDDYGSHYVSDTVYIHVGRELSISGILYDEWINSPKDGSLMSLQYYSEGSGWKSFTNGDAHALSGEQNTPGYYSFSVQYYSPMILARIFIAEYAGYAELAHEFNLGSIPPTNLYLQRVEEDNAPWVNHPADMVIFYQEEANISWMANDGHPVAAWISEDNTDTFLRPRFHWLGEDIDFCLKVLAVGSYNITLHLEDSTDNIVTDTVEVIVKSRKTIVKKIDYFEDEEITPDWQTRISTPGIEQTFSEGNYNTGNWGTRNVLRMDEGNTGTGRSRYDYYQDLGESFSGDFELSAIIGLYQPYSGEMAFNGLTILDENWNPIAYGGMYDAWSGSTKKDCAGINGQTYSTGYIFNTPNRAIGVKIQRVGDTWTVYLDTDQDSDFTEFTTPLLTETCTTTARYIGFYFYQYSTYKNPNYFAWTDDFNFKASPISSDTFDDSSINSVWDTRIITVGMEQTFTEGSANTGTWGSRDMLRMDEGTTGTGRSYYAVFQDLGDSFTADFTMSAIVGMYQPTYGEMAFIRLAIWDENWNVIAEGGLYDAWAGTAKKDCAYLNGQAYSTGYNFMANRAHGVKIQRSGDSWSVFLDTDQDSNFGEFSTPILTDTCTSVPRYVGFEFFQYSTYKQAGQYCWADDFSFSL